MQFPILQAMLGDEILAQLVKSWPDKCFDAHGPLKRLPAPFTEDILGSIAALTEAYQGGLLEFDPRTQSNKMYRLADGTASDVIKKGATAYLDDVSPLLNHADAFVNALEQELNIKPGSTRLTIFISAAGSGAPTHYDALDVISIQLVGGKKFFTSPLQQIRFPYDRQYSEGDTPFTTLYPQISQGYPSCKNQSFEQVDMLPGSVLFMPRGTWHYTEAEEDSMSMSIVLNPPTQVDHFLSQLKITLLQDAAWRSPCYGLGNKVNIDTKLYGKLPNTIYKLAKNQQNPESPLRTFHKDSRYLRNPGVEAQITAGEVFYRIEYPQLGEKGIIGTVKMEVSKEIAGIFQWFMRQDGPFTVGECKKNFPTVSPADFNELFFRAGESGLLKKLWFVEL
jgi:hypothetical protein